MAGRALLVIKVGGSLLKSPKDLSWLAAQLNQARRPIVVVPGGGPFADIVRQVQKDVGFGDATAHEMAILGMHQFGVVLASMMPRARMVETLEDINASAAEGLIAVCSPLKLCKDDSALPRDWSVTSDGIAARLAERLDAQDLVLVKSVHACDGASLKELVAEGFVDPTYAAIVERANLRANIIGVDEEARLRNLLDHA